MAEDKAIFNYRLSRARCVIENTFGILTSRWRIFRCPIIAEPEKAVIYTKAAIALHNFLRTTECSIYCPPGFIDSEDGMGNIVAGSWRDEGQTTGLDPVPRVGSNRFVYDSSIIIILTPVIQYLDIDRYSRCAADIRNTFKDYFSTPAGEVSWQYDYVRRTS